MCWCGPTRPTASWRIAVRWRARAMWFRRSSSPPNAMPSRPSGATLWESPYNRRHVFRSQPVARQCVPHLRSGDRGPATLLPDAADEPVEFASAGLSADRADRQCQMPVLRRRVHPAPWKPVRAEPVLRLLRTAVRGPGGQGAWFVHAAADAPVTRDWVSVRYWMARYAVVARH